MRSVPQNMPTRVYFELKIINITYNDRNADQVQQK